MTGTFAYNDNLHTIQGIEAWNVSSKCVNLYNMFVNSQITSLDLSNWDTSNIVLPAMNEVFRNCDSLHTLHLDNWDNETISKIIGCSYFPKGAISGVTRTIYCKEENAAGLTPPRNWVFSFINN
jgi:surface protein